MYPVVIREKCVDVLPNVGIQMDRIGDLEITMALHQGPHRAADVSDRLAEVLPAVSGDQGQPLGPPLERKLRLLALTADPLHSVDDGVAREEDQALRIRMLAREICGGPRRRGEVKI